MSHVFKLTPAMVEKAIGAYRAAGGEHEETIRDALEAALELETFQVGDEVICGHGNVLGVVLSINCDEAVISWACRGKSTEKLSDLEHVEHVAALA
ncbi:MAG: preprotein translocase subunit YajC [Alsobacter sp.]